MNELQSILKRIKPTIDWEKENDLVESGILDSIDIVEIVDAICEHYKFELGGDDYDPDNFRSLTQIYQMVEKHLATEN